MTDPAARAWGWVAHLRAGGTTPWARWDAPGDPRGRVVPGAQQLELLRRLNHRGDLPEGLADRVLVADAAGRGRPDLELDGVGDPRFGFRPVDPSGLEDDELLRVAAPLLAENLVALGPVRRPRSRRPRPWRRRYRLVGDPLLVDPLRAAMRQRGRPPRAGGEVVVLGTDLGSMLAHTWVDACFSGAVGPWPDWLESRRQRPRLPRAIDLAHQAQVWAQRRGSPGNVHVLTGTDGLPPLLGVRSLPPTPPLPGATAAELARRVSNVLGLLVPADQRPTILRRGLLPRLPDDVLDDDGPGIPDQHREWVRRRAGRMARRLAQGDYAEVPTAADLRPRRAGAPDTGAVLDLALRLLRKELGGPGAEGGERQ